MQFCYNDHHRIRVLLSAVVSPACIQWAATCWFQFDSNVDTNTYDLADRRAVFSTSQLLGANSACKTATDVLSSVEITVYKVLAYRLAGGITPEQAPHRILHASAVHQHFGGQVVQSVKRKKWHCNTIHLPDYNS